MPRKQQPNRQPPAGFTLIEVLLALVMFATIAGVIFAAFAAVMDGVEKGRQSAEFYRVGRGALQRMTQEISAAVGPGIDPRALLRGEHSTAASQPRDHITFWTIPYRRFAAKVPEDELCAVSYALANDAQGRPALFRTENCTLDEEQPEAGTVLALTDMAVGLKLTYYDATGEHESWPPGDDAESPLPCQIRVVLILRDAREYERVFFTTVPLLMRGTCESKEK